MNNEPSETQIRDMERIDRGNWERYRYPYPYPIVPPGVVIPPTTYTTEYVPVPVPSPNSTPQQGQWSTTNILVIIAIIIGILLLFGIARRK